MSSLPSDEYKTILDEINSLKTKLAVTDYFITNFKDDSLSSTKKLDELKERVSSLEIKFYNNFQDVERSIKDKVNELDTKIVSMQNSIIPLTTNSFLTFSNNMDIKKWVTLGGLVVSILASAGVLDNVLSKNINQDQLNNKIEQLIKLTE